MDTTCRRCGARVDDRALRCPACDALAPAERAETSETMVSEPETESDLPSFVRFRIRGQELRATPVVVVDVTMPFTSMMVFMINSTLSYSQQLTSRLE